jgi:hypothetical protein
MKACPVFGAGRCRGGREFVGFVWNDTLNPAVQIKGCLIFRLKHTRNLVKYDMP